MDDMTFLGIVCTEQAVDGSIPSAFVAIAPQHDTRMVYIARQHFANKPGTRRGIVSILPACQFINIKQAQRVAGIQEMLIRRIMGTDSVHIHFFDELHVLYAKFFIRGSSTIGMERVAVDSLHNQYRSGRARRGDGNQWCGNRCGYPQSDVDSYSYHTNTL